VEIAAEGRGFTIESLRDHAVPMEDHLAAGHNAWESAVEAVQSGKYKLVVLDEILGSITAGLVAEDDVVSLMRSKPVDLHLVLTGRGAPQSVIDAADCVTEMREIKHHYRGAGIPAQRGIEF
jgi:cob(I)alamin adenosyltransferase